MLFKPIISIYLALELVAWSQCSSEEDDSGSVETRVGPGNEDCNCVPFYMCPNGRPATNGKSLVNFRQLLKTCLSVAELCCPKEEVKVPVIPQSNPVRLNSCMNQTTRTVDFRIINNKHRSNEAQFGEFPWMGAVYRIKEKDGAVVKAYTCGGSLIHPKVLLTAAHCVDKLTLEETGVRVGEWDLSSDNELTPHQDRPVSKIIIHEEYSSINLFNDIALLVMSTPVKITPYVGIVCSAKPSDIDLNSNCLTTGWGKSSSGMYQAILKKVSLPLVAHEECQSRLRGTVLGPKFVLHKNFLCAGGIADEDSCLGDGGSPLVCPVKGDSNNYAQVGIVSWGIDCGKPWPAAYVNVSSYQDWIDANIKKYM